MNNAIIIHGKPDKAEYYDDQFPSASNSHWIPWLQKQLLIYDIAAQTPEIPHAYDPQYPTWEKEFERYDIHNGTILVGHSCGGGFLLRWLSEHPDSKVGNVVLVAPWLDPEKELTTGFFDFHLDPLLAQRTKQLSVFYSDNDVASIHTSIELIRKQISGCKFREFPGYGHFTVEDAKLTAFPDLLQELL